MAAQLGMGTGNLSICDGALPVTGEVDVEETGNGFAPILGVNLSLGDKLNIGIEI